MRREYEVVSLAVAKNMIKGAYPVKDIPGINDGTSKFKWFIDPKTLTIYKLQPHEKDPDNKIEILTIPYSTSKAINNAGYKIIDMQGARTMHSVVAHTFCQKPKDFDNYRYEINHIDQDKLNNHPSNLEWVTKSDNMLHHYSYMKARGLVHTHKNNGKYNYHTRTFLDTNGNRVKMSPVQYLAYRKEHDLPVRPVIDRFKLHGITVLQLQLT